MNQETEEIIMAVRKIIALSLFAVVLLSACAPLAANWQARNGG
jgi:hypothetical protein